LRKGVRKKLFEITLYSEGSFKAEELWKMTPYMIDEILEVIKDRNEKQKQEIEKAKGKQITKF
jgi:hypothetical protein